MKKIFTARFLFIAAIIALCSFSFLSYRRIELLMLSSKMVTHTTEVKLELEHLVSALKDAEAGHRGYLLTHDQRFLESFNKGLKAYPQYISSIKALTKDNSEQQNNLEKIQLLANRRVNYMFRMLEVGKTRIPTADEMLGGKQIMDSLQAAINKVEGIESNLLHARNADLKRQSLIAPVWLLFFTLASLGILVVAFLTIVEQIKARKKTEKSKQELQRLFKQAPVTIVVYRGENLIVDVANTFALEMWGKTEQEVIGKPFFEISPELKETQEPLLRKILETGEPFVGSEFPAQYSREGKLYSGYFDFVYRPTYNSENKITGIIAVGTEVTRSVLARKKIEESEERFRTLATEAPLFVWLTDENLQTTFLNKNGLDYFNLDTSTQMTDLSWKKFIHPDDLERVLSVMKIAAAQHESYTLEMRLKNGATCEYRWFLDKGAPQYAGDRFTGFIGTSFDIHDRIISRKKIEQSEENYRLLSQTLEQKVQQRTAELQERNQFIEAIIDSSQELIAVYDKNFTLLSLNKACAKTLGVNADDLTGRKLQELFPEAVGAKSEADLARAFKGESVQNEPFFSAISGRYIQNYIVPLRDENGDVYAALAIAHDITEIKKAEEDLKRSQEQLVEQNASLERMNQELASFSYIASHDLQEPLRKIRMFSKRIVEKDHDVLSIETKDYFRRIENAAARMQQLIEDLLSYSRTNTAQTHFEKTNLNKLLEEVTESMREKITQANAVIETHELPELTIIPFQFRQLLTNLVSNSIKFTKPGVAPHIQIKHEVLHGENKNGIKGLQKRKYHHFIITDNGIGFEPEYNEHIFGLFQRLHGRNEFEGTGIGLAICKKIVENHDGVITADGEPDNGSTFNIYIPL